MVEEVYPPQIVEEERLLLKATLKAILKGILKGTVEETLKAPGKATLEAALKATRLKELQKVVVQGPPALGLEGERATFRASITASRDFLMLRIFEKDYMESILYPDISTLDQHTIEYCSRLVSLFNSGY